MNQGEFRVYSPDGSISGIDTIRVQGGRFEYSMECHGEGIIVIVLPNYYELPVFVEPGEGIELRADASHIKDIEITGNDANEQMSQWRKENNDLTIVQQQSAASKFINDNPKSIVSRWLLYKYFVCAPKPDHKRINQLAKTIKQSLADDISSGKLSMGETSWITRLEQGAGAQQGTQVGDRLPKFNATDIYGKTVSSADYMKGYAVITVFTTYNYDSQNINRQLKYKYKPLMATNNGPRPMPTPPSVSNGARPMPSALPSAKNGVIPKILSINLDASVIEAKNAMHRDTLPWSVVCDQKMWDSPLIKILGVTRLPDNIVVKDGKIIARGIPYTEIEKLIK